jgi:hypothetical protein
MERFWSTLANCLFHPALARTGVLTELTELTEGEIDADCGLSGGAWSVERGAGNLENRNGMAGFGHIWPFLAIFGRRFGCAGK